MTENVKTQGENVAQPQTDEYIIANLIKNLPKQDAVPVELPSKNKFYGLVNDSLPVTLRPMTFQDEKALVSNKNVQVDSLNLLLERCVSNINIGKLLLMDKLYLIMKLREVSYGSEYTVAINCPQCRKENKITFDLTHLNVKYVEDDFTVPVAVKLPVLKKTVKVILPRVSDEQYLQNAEISSSNMWRFIEEIDGHTKKTIISGVLQKLPIQDIHAILKTLNSEKYGIDPNVRFACSYCSHHEVTELPITSDFFTGN